MSYAKENLIHHYRALLRIRRAEEVLADEYRKGVMRTPTHFGIGQEAVALGICDELAQGDVVYSHHRAHTHYLAKGGSLFKMIAELLGREDGCSRGRGGSVHLVDVNAGFLGSSPILGHSVALATGSALAFKMDSKNLIAVAFFGEGACDEGAVWESFNFASIHKLPVLFVCENNLYATESPLAVRQASGTDLCERAESFKVPAQKLDGNDLIAVSNAASDAVAYIRKGNGPKFLECMTYRWREHVGPLWDHEVSRSYRDKEELEQWMQLCPVKKLGEFLIREKIANVDDLNLILLDVDKEINIALQDAYASPWPDPKSLFDNVY